MNNICSSGEALYERARRFGALSLMVLFLTACAERGVIETAPATPAASVHEIYVAQFRQQSGQIKNFGERRPGTLRFERSDVSVPPTHRIGQIEWPKRRPDASRDFVTVGGRTFTDIRSFARAVAAADTSGQNETLIHIHGYNTTHGEAVYGAAQVSHDMEIPVPFVLFSWPSAAQAKGYVYDRDSALISRDMLEELIVAFAQYPGREVFISAHSMGGYLLMETLRQISSSGRLNIAEDINGVLLLSPDIDTELFREQVKRIGNLPDPFLVMVAEQDRALRISSLLTGRGVRLGSLTDPGEIEGLGVTLVDVSALSDGRGLEHSIGQSSPAAIAVMRKLSEETPPGEISAAESIVKVEQQEGFLSRLASGP